MLDATILRSYNAVRTTPNTDVFCHAPFASVNFAQSGDATVCCYNRKYVLGTYPAASLDDIWNGQRAQELRRAMARNELPMGCDICLSQFQSSNFSGLRARSFDHLAEAEYRDDGVKLLSYPKLMEFEISNVCNLECTMCTGFFSSSIRHNREHLPPLKSPYDDAFVKSLDNYIPHLREARFLGGEPFLIRTYYQIWESIARLNPGMTVNITTNATMVNDRVKRVLDSLAVNVIVSIDSVSRDSYERIRVNADFGEVMENVEYLRSYTQKRGTWMALAVCPMRQNWRDVPDIVRYCNTRHIGVYFNTVTFPGDATFQYMTREDLEEIVTYLAGSRDFAKSPTQPSNDKHYSDLINQVQGYRDQKLKVGAGQRIALPSSGWTLETPRGTTASLAAAAAPDAPLLLTINETDGERGNSVRLASPPVVLRTDQRYIFRFSARANSLTEITSGAMGGAGGYKNRGAYIRFGIGQQWERFEFDFVPNVQDDRSRFVFDTPLTLAEIELRDIVLRVVPLGGGDSTGGA